MTGTHTREILRFGDFDLDLEAYELRRGGRAVRLERQPMDLLILLVTRRGALVARTEIVDRLWGKDVFVDVETGVNTAVRKVRQALRDSTDAPRFVETVAGKGYRFIGDVQAVASAAPGTRGDPPVVPVEPPVRPEPGSRRRLAAAAGLMALVAIGIVLVAVLTRQDTVGLPATIAVLPFENLSGDPERDYLAEGLAEETIVSLGQIDPERLHVIARTSTHQLRSGSRSASEIGRELNADYLVESSLRTEGGRIRITSKLVRTRDQVQVWSQSFDRELVSVLGLQQELSTAIAERIRLRLSADRLDSLARRQTQDAQAYDLYLRGLTFANQRTPPTTLRAIDYFTQATVRDPDYALAWAGIAMSLAASPINGDAAPQEVVPRAREAAERAIRADPSLAEARHVIGYLNWCCDWKWPEAETDLRRGVELDPQSAMGHVTLGHVLSQLGKQEEAQAQTRRAREIDPLNSMVHALSSQVAYQGRDYQAASELAQRAIAIAPEFWIGHVMRGQAAGELGDLDGALDALATAARFSGTNSKALAFRAYFLARAGRANDARAVLETLESASQVRYVPPYNVALIYAALNEPEETFAWLERAFAARDVHLMFLPVDPKWDGLRQDPRFSALLARCGFRR